jgi:hypothetical protein
MPWRRLEEGCETGRKYAEPRQECSEFIEGIMELSGESGFIGRQMRRSLKEYFLDCHVRDEFDPCPQNW